jgi:hypothetical protein
MDNITTYHWVIALEAAIAVVALYWAVVRYKRNCARQEAENQQREYAWFDERCKGFFEDKQPIIGGYAKLYVCHMSGCILTTESWDNGSPLFNIYLLDLKPDSDYDLLTHVCSLRDFRERYDIEYIQHPCQRELISRGWGIRKGIHLQTRDPAWIDFFNDTFEAAPEGSRPSGADLARVMRNAWAVKQRLALQKQTDAPDSPVTALIAFHNHCSPTASLAAESASEQPDWWPASATQPEPVNRDE